MKDPTPLKYKSIVVYQFVCPGCGDSYVGKTERNLSTWCQEHATKKDSTIFDHLKECSEISYLTTLLTFGVEKPNYRSIRINIVNDNTKIIDSSSNWSSLLYKEALYIKRLKPVLNNCTFFKRKQFFISLLRSFLTIKFYLFLIDDITLSSFLTFVTDL